MTQTNKTIDELYAENTRIVLDASITDDDIRVILGEPKTITEALLDAWEEFTQEINRRPSDIVYLDDYARVELFKMMVDLKTDKSKYINLRG